MLHKHPSAMPEPVETPRLQLSPPVLADLPVLAGLWHDERVRQYLGGVVSQEVAGGKIDWLQRHWNECGFGPWSVYEKATGLLTGLCGLHYSTEGIEISYSFFSPFWRQGFATEAARASFDHGFRVLAIERVIGITQSANTASCRLLERLGMHHTDTFRRWEAEQHFYELTRKEWSGELNG